MGTKKYKPNTPGFRQRQVNDFKSLTNDKVSKSLTKSLRSKSGRNNVGKVTVRWRGGRSRRHYRLIDFKRKKAGVPGQIMTIEYDPNRSANISLVHYKDGEKTYIITPLKSKVGDTILTSDSADIKVGNSLPIYLIPVGSLVHNIELRAKGGAKLVRSAGCYATITGRQENYVTLKLPSGEVRLIHNNCLATIGQVGNTENRNTVKGKAGASRWSGKRPRVRGSVMNACDHPHGGGEGRAPIGHASPRTPWGKPALGYKTRNKKKHSKKYILR
ncbi:50S ribosomal protein L2 [Candidatus Marinamargulisbacteria bacterium SCGC AG-333-B06]|nr:50S ribosomal protein L2 [Candidatus Marinamargulisbacteria bacterium SCGC AG-333-B06]